MVRIIKSQPACKILNLRYMYNNGAVSMVSTSPLPIPWTSTPYPFQDRTGQLHLMFVLEEKKDRVLTMDDLPGRVSSRHGHVIHPR